MLEIFEKWYRRYFFEEESILLLVLLAIAIVLLMTIGDVLAPVLAAIVLAYLADGLATRLKNIGVPHSLAFIASFLLFISVFFCVSFGLLPLVFRLRWSFELIAEGREDDVVVPAVVVSALTIMFCAIAAVLSGPQMTAWVVVVGAVLQAVWLGAIRARTHQARFVK